MQRPEPEHWCKEMYAGNCDMANSDVPPKWKAEFWIVQLFPAINVANYGKVINLSSNYNDSKSVFANPCILWLQGVS